MSGFPRPPAFCLPLILAVMVTASPAAQAASGEPLADLPPGLASAMIAPGWQTPDGQRIAALKLDLDPGWKTYWRVPGEAGIPPRIDFTGSKNLGHVEIVWPRPEVFDDEAGRTVGYRDEMLLPLRITPADPSQPVELSAHMDIGLCHDICVPATLALHGILAGPGGQDGAIATALRDAPERHDGTGGLAECRTEKLDDGTRVDARIDLPLSGDETAMFELRNRPMWVSDAQTSTAQGIFRASSDFVPDDSKPFDLDPKTLRITLLGRDGSAVEIDGCAAD